MIPEIGYTFTEKAVLKKSETYGYILTHFGLNPEHKRHYGVRDEDTIVDVKCTVIDIDLSLAKLYNDEKYDENCVDYFAYFPYDNRFGIIYCNIKAFNCCFPYGADAACFNKNGERIGTICRLNVEVLSEYKPNDL